jgi:hypothetical protein
MPPPGPPFDGEDDLASELSPELTHPVTNASAATPAKKITARFRARD